MENLTKTEGNEVILQNGGYKMHTFEEVKEVYLSYISDEKSKKLIEDAYAFVCKKHAGIYRKSGEPYVHHLIEVAYIIATLQGGPVTIASGLLHDVVEDTDTTIEDINKLFTDKEYERNHHLSEMQAWWDKVRKIKLSYNKKLISNEQLIDWFFTASQDYSDLISDKYITNYKKFISLLLIDRNITIKDIFANII